MVLGGGKIIVVIGFMVVFCVSGWMVVFFKVGLDYIDFGYYLMVSGCFGCNFDFVMCGDEFMVFLLVYGFVIFDLVDIVVIEGVMGLFDG